MKVDLRVRAFGDPKSGGDGGGEKPEMAIISVRFESECVCRTLGTVAKWRAVCVRMDARARACVCMCVCVSRGWGDVSSGE